ncbi:hypothetical protein AAKU55_003892 [Oxalobacteraceae bacterium GrIS 1.11]
MSNSQDQDGGDCLPADFDFSRANLFEAHLVSPEIRARSLKNTAIILRAMRAETAKVVAEKMGIHDSALSRWQGSGNGYSALMFCCMALAGMGLKVVPVEARVFIEPDELK